MADLKKCKAKSSRQISVILLGRAGSGRTNLLADITEHLRAKKKNTFNINLDPLTESNRLYNINISDTSPYEDIKLYYNFTNTKTLFTSLNIFTSKIDQLKKILLEKTSSFEYIFVDTPNPDEFLCSPSGLAIPRIFASEYPTVILYVMDCQRCQDPLVLMRTIIDACSVKMKFGLPLVVVCNKNDLVDWTVIQSWMDDSSLLMEALLEKEFQVSNDISSKIYDFPKLCEELKIVSTSVKNNTGIEDLVQAIDDSRIEYENSYKSNQDEIDRMLGMVRKQISDLRDDAITCELLNIPIKESCPGEYDISNDDVNEALVDDCIQRNLSMLQSKLRENGNAEDDDNDEYEEVMKKHFSSD